MNTIDLYSEPFAATGNIAGEGFRKLLGRPSLNLIQTVIREAIQNSVDAASNGKQVEIRLRYRELSEAQRSFMLKNVFEKMPDSRTSAAHLRSTLTKDSLRVLEICDYGTSGLGGPTRADVPPEDGESPDFVNFIRNVGAKRDTHQGGGTYGYGKSSYYSVSAASTILVDSLTECNGVYERRFIGCHLGEAFDSTDDGGCPRRYTGRHWWGVLDAGDGVEPIRGNDASMVADSIGLLSRIDGESGTSVMILDPQFGSVTTEDARDELLEAVLWNFWPRMTESTPSEKRLHVKLEVDGVDEQIPCPEDFPPLDLYSRALLAIREGRDGVQTIRCGKPKKDLGHLSIQKGMCATRKGSAARPAEKTRIPRISHAIALMPLWNWW